MKFFLSLLPELELECVRMLALSGPVFASLYSLCLLLRCSVSGNNVPLLSRTSSEDDKRAECASL